MVHSFSPPANPQHPTLQTEEAIVESDLPICSTSLSWPCMTTKTSKRCHQHEAHHPDKSPGQRKTHKQTEHKVEPSALWSSYSWKSHWQLDLHLWIWLWFRMEDRGPCPALTPVTVSVMALIAVAGLWMCTSGHWGSCQSIANRWKLQIALSYGDKVKVVWLCWAFLNDSWCAEKHKNTDYTVPLVPTPSQFHLTPLPCGGQRKLLGSWWVCSHGVMTFRHHVSVTAVIKPDMTEPNSTNIYTNL